MKKNHYILILVLVTASVISLTVFSRTSQAYDTTSGQNPNGAVDVGSGKSSATANVNPGTGSTGGTADPVSGFNGSTWADDPATPAVNVTGSANSATTNTTGSANAAPTNTTGGANSAPVNTTGGANPADSSNKTITLSNPLDKKFNSVGALVEGFVEIFTYLVVIFAVIMIIWTGLQYILAGGNTEKMKQASIKLGWLVVGVAVVIGARVIVHVVINTLQATGTVNQNVIQSANNAINNK